MTLSFSTSLSAHSTTTGLFHDTSVTHWDIYETYHHWGSYLTEITVDCGDFSDSTNKFKSFIQTAIKDWNDASFNGSDLLTITEDNTNGTVIFLDRNADEMDTKFHKSGWAITNQEDASCDSNHHYSTTAGNIEIWVDWTGKVSKTKTDQSKEHVPKHELGHVIGLKDISSNVSVNSYLMCNGFGNSTAPTTITNADLQGAAVILGQHTTHNFSSTYIFHNSSYHRQPCNKCGAYKLYNHTYSNGTCTKCGYSK